MTTAAKMQKTSKKRREDRAREKQVKKMVKQVKGRGTKVTPKMTEKYHKKVIRMMDRDPELAIRILKRKDI